MKEHPILFSGEMVQAILDGRKTQTRRVIKPQPPEEYPIAVCDSHGLCCWSDDGTETGDWYPDNPMRCPYGKAGDRLWVRETFVMESNFNLDSEENYPPPFNDERPIKRTDCEEYGKYWQQCHYRATDPKPDLVNQNTDEEWGWTPSIHMPRWASRITLEIVAVRVEHVQSISYRDCVAEGIQAAVVDDPGHVKSSKRLKADYQNLWDIINAKRGYGWDVNPWVWVIKFKRVETVNQ